MSLYIALLALAVAVVAVIRGNRTADRLHQLEQRRNPPDIVVNDGDIRNVGERAVEMHERRHHLRDR